MTSLHAAYEMVAVLYDGRILAPKDTCDKIVVLVQVLQRDVLIEENHFLHVQAECFALLINLRAMQRDHDDRIVISLGELCRTNDRLPQPFFFPCIIIHESSHLLNRKISAQNFPRKPSRSPYI